MHWNEFFYKFQAMKSEFWNDMNLKTKLHIINWLKLDGIPNKVPIVQQNYNILKT